MKKLTPIQTTEIIQLIKSEKLLIWNNHQTNPSPKIAYKITPIAIKLYLKFSLYSFDLLTNLKSFIFLTYHNLNTMSMSLNYA